MNDSSANEITTILVTVLGALLVILVVMIIVFLVLKVKDNKKKKIKLKEDEEELITSGEKEDKKNKKNVGTKNPIALRYDRQSILDFMEFDDIKDNMIVQKAGKRYLMVVECKGVNYDLMSEPEKISVEEGFQQFLNTLRHPIQIYIQTKTVNLESSINRYKEYVKRIEAKYRQVEYEYRKMRESGQATIEELDRKRFELTKQQNLLEYGKDIIANTEKMSLNKGVLSKNFYIIVPYYVEEVNSDNYYEDETRSIAFSELYTKSQSIIRTLSSCSVSGRILNSKELIELLYVSYNRDDSEVYGIDKLARTSFDNLYSTAPDVFQKKIKVLDAEINKKAMEIANNAIDNARQKSKAQLEAEKTERDLEELAKKMAELIIDQNKNAIGYDIAEEAVKEIKEDSKQAKTSKRGKGGKKDVKEEAKK